MATYVLLRVLAVVLLVAANAFFVAAEFALVSVRDTRIQQLVEIHRIGARTVQKLHSRIDELLAAVQLGVTLASLALGWIGEEGLARLLESAFQGLHHPGLYAHVTAILLAFILITYLHTTLGELVPKSVALHRAERVALAVAGPMDIFITATKPFLYVMTHTARLLLRAFGVPQIRQGGVHSPEELKLVVTASRRLGLLPTFAEELIHRTLEMGDVTAREIMVPRPDIFSLPADMSLDEALTSVVEEQHSRVPVYERKRGPEHIIGVLYSKDLTRWMRLRLVLSPETAERLAQMEVRHLMRDVLVVPETKPLPDLLTEFKLRKRHLAVVVDEFGSTVGVVTVEDVLEQLVGEIEDEFDVARQPLPAVGTTMLLDASVPLRDLETQYQLKLPREEGYETLAGFVLARLQKIPRGGEKFEFGGRRFTITEMDGHRIAKVKIEQAEEPAGKKAD
jgi:CBS domain containing-hemolysin-like protein